MLVGLDSYGTDGDTCIKASVDEYLVIYGCVEVVKEQSRLGITLVSLFKDFADKAYSPLLLADSCNGVVVLIKNGHDNNFVDDVPHVNNALKTCDFTLDSLKLLFKYGLVVIFHEPVGAYSVPTEGVALDLDVFTLKVFCCIHEHLFIWLTFLGFVIAPVKGKRSVIKDIEPALRYLFCPVITVHYVWDKIKGSAAE